MGGMEQMTRLWDKGDDEDRQALARIMFEYVVFDLDTRQIVGYRLKPWSERYLVLRTALYEQDDDPDDDIDSVAVSGPDDDDPGDGGGNSDGEGTKKFHPESFKDGTVSCPKEP